MQSQNKKSTKMPRGGKSHFNCFGASSSSDSPPPQPLPRPLGHVPEPIPDLYLCPISKLPMAEPVIIIPTTYTMERACFEACQDLNYIPPFVSANRKRGFLSLSYIQDRTLQGYIGRLCESTGHPKPVPVSQESARAIIQDLQAQEAASISAPSSTGPTHPQEEAILKSLKKLELEKDANVLAALDYIVKNTGKGKGISLCTPRIVPTLIPLLFSGHRTTQVKATDAILALSSSVQGERIKMVRWGIVPPLLDLLTVGVLHARANALKTIHNLALVEVNRTAIGALGAIPILLEKFFEYFSFHEARKEAALALSELSLCDQNLEIFVSLGAIPRLFRAAIDKSSNEASLTRRYAIQLLYALARDDRARDEMMLAGVVRQLLRMIKEGDGIDTDCLLVIYRICTQSPEKFKVTAAQEGAKVVLKTMKVGWTAEEKKMAKQMLQMLKNPKKKGKEQFKPVLTRIREELEGEQN